MKTGLFQVRLAVVSDAKGILKAHHSAVHQTASSDYSPEILEEWSKPVTRERIQDYLENSFSGELTLVAETRDGEIAGFGAIVVSASELRAVYVAREWSGMGVGRFILAELEKRAIQRGVATLSMDSSVTALAFYQANGYQIVKHAEHVLRSGRKMKCIKMTKNLVN